MKNTQNVRMLSPLEWAEIIGKKYWNEVVMKFFSYLDKRVSKEPAFAPCCYFNVLETEEGIEYWTEINDYAQWVVGNTDENIMNEIINWRGWIEVEEDEPMFDTDSIIDKLLLTKPWKATIASMVIMTGHSEKQLVDAIKNEANKDPDAINRLTELLKKSQMVESLTK